ncbi:hypothetical protein [Halorussus ruber]|uniref:hypothetical protein n=1 Tax=Halorussus ruber TaxID=1126238 RepID=UPI001091C74F|nr:hypothetical protein [Halorussus ruber]
MALNVWEVFLALFGSNEETDEASGEEASGSRFIPSPLDLSVRVGHGSSESERVRELSKINERARELEENRRDN